MLTKIKKLIPFSIPALSLIAPAVALADDAKKVPTQDTASIKPSDFFPKDFTVVELMRNIIRFILIVAFVIAFIMLLVGGIRWILAGGDEKAVEKARGTITAALIGLVVVLIAFALIKMVETFFGVSVLTGAGVGIPTVQQAQ